MKKIKFILILLIFDLTLSNLIFKNTQYWSNLNWEEKWWRVSSKDYHHKNKRRYLSTQVLFRLSFVVPFMNWLIFMCTPDALMRFYSCVSLISVDFSFGMSPTTDKLQSPRQESFLLSRFVDSNCENPSLLLQPSLHHRESVPNKPDESVQQQIKRRLPFQLSGNLDFFFV